MVFDEMPKNSNSEGTAEKERLIQELAANSNASEEEVRNMVGRMAGDEMSDEEMKQLEVMTKFASADLKGVFSRLGLLLMQFSLLTLVSGIGILSFQADGLSDIINTYDEMEIASWLTIIGFWGMVSGISLLIFAGKFSSRTKQFIDSSIQEIAEFDPALAAEMQDTPEDLQPLYVDDRRHQW